MKSTSNARRSGALLLFALATGIPSSAADVPTPVPVATAGRWTASGLPNTSLRALVAARGLLYASTVEAGVYASRDDGRHWRLANHGLDITTGTPFLLAIEPTRPDLVYASDGTTLYRSIDGAGTWSPLSFAYGQIGAIAVAPSRPRTLYALSFLDRRIYIDRSNDRGTTWFCTPTPFKEVQRLLVDPHNPDTLLVTSGGDIQASTNSGISWTRATPPNHGVIGIAAFDPLTPRRIYAGGDGFVARSSDLGKTWRFSTSGLPQPGHGVGGASTLLTMLVSDPTRPATLYTGSYGRLGQGIGIFVSHDGGNAWTNASRGLPRERLYPDVVVDSVTGRLFAETLGNGVFSFTPSQP